jgi:DNA-directed RNA polymerase subunit E'/Rpb7|uniref:S1 motif domain-containing protein n=1 Tax=viral metagenome TaxID=1070528 RepID=A0A6C0DT64_9ZZZZ
MEQQLTTKVTQQKYKKRETKINTIYSRCLITRNILLPITNIGKNIKETIEKNIIFNYEGKCVVEGFIKPNSSKIVTYSSGLIQGTNISFEVVFECEICCPVEGMLISCVAKNITKAGVRAESADETPSPVVVFVARDHHFSVSQFSNIQEGDKFVARVIGQRFELNDKYVSIIAELVVEKTQKKKEPAKPKLVFEED